jgi:Tol biopolymer transport system component
LNDSDGSPKWIVWFRVKSDGKSNLFLRQIDLSSTEVNISPNQDANYWDPECSPDGKKIAFVYDSTGTSTCSTVIAVAEINQSKTLLVNQTTISDTTPRARTDPSWNPSSTKICYDIWDYDLVQYPSACWSVEGLQDGYQQYWRIIMVNADGSGSQIIFSAVEDDPFPFLPIWKKDDGSEILVSGVYSKQSNKDEGKYFQPYLLRKGGNNQYSAEVYRNDTLNCVWFDYVEVTK